jgi:hypothetical protein
VPSAPTCKDLTSNKASAAIQDTYKSALAAWLDELGPPLGVAAPVSTTQRIQCQDPAGAPSGGILNKRLRVLAKTRKITPSAITALLGALNSELQTKCNAFPQRVAAQSGGGDVQASSWAGTELRYKRLAAQMLDGPSKYPSWDPTTQLVSLSWAQNSDPGRLQTDAARLECSSPSERAVRVYQQTIHFGHTVQIGSATRSSPGCVLGPAVPPPQGVY